MSLAWGWLLVHFLEKDARNSREVIPPVVIFHAVGEEASGIGQNLSTRESCLTDAPSPSRCRDMRHLDIQMSRARQIQASRWNLSLPQIYLTGGGSRQGIA